MAIGTTPLFSKISGSVGPVDYRTRHNGKIEIGKKRIPTNPQSTEQQNTRNAYGRLHELWQNEAWIDKTQYENIAAAYDISPWNAFLMRHLPIMRLNPVAYWPFVEGSGNTLHDFTLNKSHGIISGPTWERTGKFEIPKLLFDGIDDYVNCGSKSLFNFSSSFGLEGWINPYLTAGKDRTVLAFSGSAINRNYEFRLKSTSNSFVTISNGTTQDTHTGSPVDLNKFSRVTGFFNEGTILGTSKNTTVSDKIPTSDLICTTKPLYIGSLEAGTYVQFNGLIGEIIIKNYYSTHDENIRLYNISKKFYED